MSYFMIRIVKKKLDWSLTQPLEAKFNVNILHNRKYLILFVLLSMFTLLAESVS